MADEPEAEHPELDDEEGGPVKSFLEHLEDLRWVLIKTVACAGVAMLFCLVGGNYVVRILERPLNHAPVLHSAKQEVKLVFGTNLLGSFELGAKDPFSSLVGTNQFTRLQIVPLAVGTNHVLGLSVHAESRAEQRLPIEIINLSPAGSFIVATKVAFYAGLVLSAPFIFYFVAQFVFPALRMREKKYVYRGLAFGGGLFLAGISFCYFVLLPVALSASVQYARWLGLGSYQWRAEDYISFVCKFMLGMGLGFELPVIILTLVKIGVLSYRTLASARRYVIVINVILGAVLTTPEVITQILMAVPLQFLYEVSVWCAWYWEQPDRAKARRRLVLVLVAGVLCLIAAWLAFKYGWPRLRQRWH